MKRIVEHLYDNPTFLWHLIAASSETFGAKIDPNCISEPGCVRCAVEIARQSGSASNLANAILDASLWVLRHNQAIENLKPIAFFTVRLFECHYERMLTREELKDLANAMVKAFLIDIEHLAKDHTQYGKQSRQVMLEAIS